MTDTSHTTTRYASAAVSAFLKTATKPQRLWYMVQGQPKCYVGNVMDDKGLREVLYPCLRGIMIGKPVGSVDDAVAEAARVKADIIATETLEPVDEAALGIDEEALELGESIDEGLAQIEDICHVATQAGTVRSEVLEEMIEDVYRDIREGRETPVLADLPFLSRFAKKQNVDTSEEDEDESDGGIVDDMLMAMRDAGAVGFLVRASVPEISDVRADGGGYSVHYGTRRLEIFYGSTYRHACLKAIDWAERQIERMKAEPKRQARGA